MNYSVRMYHGMVDGRAYPLIRLLTVLTVLTNDRVLHALYLVLLFHP